MSGTTVTLELEKTCKEFVTRDALQNIFMLTLVVKLFDVTREWRFVSERLFANVTSKLVNTGHVICNVTFGLKHLIAEITTKDFTMNRFPM